MSELFKAYPEDWARVRDEAKRHGGPFNCILETADVVMELSDQIALLKIRLDKVMATLEAPKTDPPFTHPEPGSGSLDLSEFTHKEFVSMLWHAACTVDNGVGFMDRETFYKAAADIREHTLRRAGVAPPAATPTELQTSAKLEVAEQPPPNCMVRLKLEGKPFLRGHCEACGHFAVRAWRCQELLQEDRT